MVTVAQRVATNSPQGRVLLFRSHTRRSKGDDKMTTEQLKEFASKLRNVGSGCMLTIDANIVISDFLMGLSEVCTRLDTIIDLIRTTKDINS